VGLYLARPAINSGQNTILTARAIGTAQLIGLHIDPTDWKLPRWERNLRKRVMWGLIIHEWVLSFDRFYRIFVHPMSRIIANGGLLSSVVQASE
jgi:hypothetical protein